MGRKTITNRLEKNITFERREELLTEWLEGWKKENARIQKMLEQGTRTQDYDLLCRATGQNKANLEKKLTALTNIIDILMWDPLEPPADEKED